MRETIFPKNEQEWLELRLHDITSTEISALYGLSPYATEFELYHQKRNKQIVEFDIGERGKWGQRLQDSIAHGIADEQGWQIRKMTEYMCMPDHFMGASFDFAIGDDGLLEIKNVDSLVFRDTWDVDGNNIEAPPHIELQVQHQLEVSGRKFAYIGALIGGNRLELIKREPDQAIINNMKSKVKAFMAAVAEGHEPKPDFSRDMEIISKIYGYSEPGSVLDARGNPQVVLLANEYRAIGEQIKILETSKSEKKAKLLMAIGNAEKTLGDGFSISAKAVEGKRVEAYDRKSYRDFRVNWSRV